MKTQKIRIEELEAKSEQKKKVTIFKDIYKPGLWFCYVNGKKEFMTKKEAEKRYSGIDITWIKETETRRKRIEKVNDMMEKHESEMAKENNNNE